MKKMLLLFLILVLNTFGAWNTINIADEFGDKTKQVSIYTQNVNKGFIRVSKYSFYPQKIDENGSGLYDEDDQPIYSNKLEYFYSVDIATKNYLAGEGLDGTTTIKLKNEKGEVSEEFTGYIWDGNPYMFSVDEEYVIDFIEFMKKSKTLKVAATDYNGDYQNETYDVTGFKTAESKIVPVMVEE